LTDLHLQLSGAGGEGFSEPASPSMAKRKPTQPVPQSFIQSLLSTIALSDNNEPELSQVIPLPPYSKRIWILTFVFINKFLQEEVQAIQLTRSTIDSADIKSIFLNTP